MNAVADAGPLIHLAEIDCLSHLAHLSSLHVSETVWEESTALGSTGADVLTSFSNMIRHTVSSTDTMQLVERYSLTGLHCGEQECLWLCMEHPLPYLLTDDLAARKAAHQFGIRPIGSLGVIAWVWRLGAIPLEEAKRQMRLLNEISSLFVTPAIVDAAIQKLTEYQKP